MPDEPETSTPTRRYNHDLLAKHTSNQKLALLVHDPSFFCIRLHVVSDVISGYVDVLEEQVSDARRAGDVHPNKKIVAETMKLEGTRRMGRQLFCIARSSRSVVPALSVSMAQYWKSLRSTKTSTKS
jgi:hypothetical protein